jgi:hypothetical protein
MNLRVRIHLPLVVPTDDSGDEQKEVKCGIRVGAVTKRWTQGKAMVLDDSFEHEECCCWWIFGIRMLQSKNVKTLWGPLNTHSNKDGGQTLVD